MGHAYKSWWTGSDLSIEESRRLVPHQNATTMQVAISVVAAAMWMIENPRARRVRARTTCRTTTSCTIAKPYLGQLPLDARPTGRRWQDVRQLFRRLHRAATLDPSDPWQFKNFLVTD